MAMLNNQRVTLILVVPSGKRLHFAMERSTIFHGTIHYFYGHFSLPEGNIKICWILLNNQELFNIAMENHHV